MQEINEEEVLLACFLNYPNMILNYLFPPNVFSSAVNEIIYYNVLELVKLYKNLDYAAIVSELKSKDLLDKCGGEQYLFYLKNIPVDTNTLDIIADNLLNRYKKRRFLSLVTKLYNSDFTDSNVIEVLNNVISEVSDISNVSAEDKVISISDALSDENIFSGSKSLVTTGFEHLDSITGGLFPGDLWYVAGRPGMGKTAWCINSINKQIEQNIPVLLFSLEMNLKPLIHRLLAVRTGIPIINLKLGILKKSELDIVKSEAEVLSSKPLYIDVNFNSGIDYISSTINRYKSVKDIQVVHIDYIQLISIADISNVVREYTKVSRMLKVLANKLNISIIGYSQLTRDVERRNDKRPLLHDLRETGGLEQDADVVVMLYRDEFYNSETKDKGLLENLIRKHREGSTGVLFSKFEDFTNRITEVL
ncbi:MAG: replicative DNA helicase [Ignavibacterium sp.]